MTTPTPTDTHVVDLRHTTDDLDTGACIDLVASTPIGRLGFAADDGLLVLPVNFAWHEDSVVFRTVEGHKLAAAAGQPVCFEVDHWDAGTRTGWSVVLRGVAREVTDWAEREQLELVGLVPWDHSTWRRMWVRVEPAEITGRILR